MKKYLSYAYTIDGENDVYIYGINELGKHTKIVKINIIGIGRKDTKEIHKMVQGIMRSIYGDSFDDI